MTAKWWFVGVIATLAAVLSVQWGGGAETATATPPPMFGDGSDGPITFSASTTFNPPADASASGTVGSTTFTVQNVSGTFSAGQRILIHQTRGSGAGAWELNTVQNYALGNIFTEDPLANTYSTGGANAAQVLVVPEYSTVGVDPVAALSAKSWDGSKGGIIAIFASQTLSVNGTIHASAAGYRGGQGAENAFQGEGYPGVGTQPGATGPNGNGGGAGTASTPQAGGGGGHATAGAPSMEGNGNPGASGGLTVGVPDLSTVFFGGGGGGSGGGGCGSVVGGSGAGTVFIFASSIQLGSGAAILANGGGGLSAGGHGSGGGAGGSILLRTQAGEFDGGTLAAIGGSGGIDGGCGCCDSENGGAGGAGRIRVEYCTSISGGTADPPASVAQISCGASSHTWSVDLGIACPCPWPWAPLQDGVRGNGPGETGTWTSPSGGDTDADGLTDDQEVAAGLNGERVDSDGDWLCDGNLVFAECPRGTEGANGTDPALNDTDGDGCADGEELGPDKALGGLRNPLNPYDFYDITDMSLVVGARDKGVSGFDLSLLLQYGGAMDGGGPNMNGKDYNADTNGNTIEDGRELDKAGLAGPGTGPDGGISGFDLSQLLSEGGDSCVAPP